MYRLCVIALGFLAFGIPASLPSLATAWSDDWQGPIQIELDATKLPRKLLGATLTIPLPAERADAGGEIALWYPKWVPGSHGPGGPIANVAGLRISDPGGQRLDWKRTVGEVGRVLVNVPAGTSSLQVGLRYITNQPTTTSMGHDSFGSALLGVVSPSTVLMYPEGADIDKVQIESILRLPPEWVASTALRVRAKSTNDAQPSEVHYQPVTLRTFVDSPIMCGRYRKVYDLVDEEQQTQENIPPHRLHIFSEAESVLKIHPEMLDKLKGMVTQAARLFGSHPYEQFDILLATTDMLPKNGLEHSRSTFNVLGQRALQEPDELKGWDRLLVPHEFIHAWCGKYRRPAGMVTSDYHTAKATELLWVYEGLTQYLGELIEARSGLMSPEEFQHRLTVEVRNALLQQGREWRSLKDTGACSHILRAGSDNWPRLRRSQDYYMEGMLFWLEADAIIRNQTDDQKSLDDFCQNFFRYDDDCSHPRAFTREDVIKSLESVVEFDWEGLIRRRIDSLVERFNPAVADALGYSIQYSNEKPDIPTETFRYTSGVDALDSLGAVFGSDGKIEDLLLDSAADKAGLGPGMKIMGINGHAWSENRLRDAITMSATTGEIELLVVSGDSFETHKVEYAGGPRYMRLVPKDESGTLLGEILEAK